MVGRKYSVSEIDSMRRALDWMLTPIGRGYNRAELTAQVEHQLRTYMLNGTDPQELQDALAKHRQREQEQRGVVKLQLEATEKFLPDPPTL